MVNIQIPKDIREYEPKFVGPFTGRQAGSVAIAALIIWGGITIEKNVLHLPAISFIPPAILAVPFLFFGFGEKLLRMKPEIYLATIFRNLVLIPKHRSYVSQNLYDICMKESEDAADPAKAAGAPAVRKTKAPPKSLPYELTAYL